LHSPYFAQSGHLFGCLSTHGAEYEQKREKKNFNEVYVNKKQEQPKPKLKPKQKHKVQAQAETIARAEIGRY